MSDGDQELSSLVAEASAEEDLDISLSEGVVEQVVVFRIGGWWFSLPPDAVGEIDALDHLNRAPSLPEHMIGLVVARNQLVPVIDLRRMWSAVPEGPSADTAERVVLVANDHDLVGLRVDEAHAIVEAVQENTTINADVPFVVGAYSWRERHVQRLDPAAFIEACLER